MENKGYNMKKIMLLSILIITIIGCTEADRELWREVEQERRERGRECTYNYKGELIGSCSYIK